MIIITGKTKKQVAYFVGLILLNLICLIHLIERAAQLLGVI